jgi:hypothetical protein
MLQGEQNVAFRPDLDIADARQILDHRLTVRQAAVLDHEALEVRAFQRTDQQMVGPLRKRIDVVDDEAGYGDRRGEVDDRLLDLLEIVVDAESLAVRSPAFLTV